jgi:acyl dehydratase
VQISPKFVGASLKEYDTEITWRRAMNYAAAVGDNNPVYFDDERPEGIIAPPMLSVAVTWRISERIWEFIEAPDFPTELLATQVHYTEHIEFHKPMRPGDRITVRGRIAAITPHKSGTIVVVRYEAVDAKGAAVFTEHIGALLRGVECLDGGRAEDGLPQATQPPQAGESLRETVVPIHELAAHIYDGCTNIFFPIHTSPAFAKSVGLPGIILQGTAVLAHAVREIIDGEAGGDPTSLKSVACRWTGMVLPGTDIRVVLEHRRASGNDLFFSVVNQDGRKAISDGYARLE